MKLLVLFMMLSSTCAQRLVDLKSFRGGGVQNALEGVAPFGIYVSAFSDSDSDLKQIKVVTADNKEVTLYDLKNKKLPTNSHELQPYQITDSAYLTTTLSDAKMSSLKGLMFISTTKQLNDNSFHVLNVDTSQSASTYGLGFTTATRLFLNTNTYINPVQSSKISGWKQDSNALIYFYRGVPTDNADGKNSQIFSNPISISDNEVFFGNVETFSLAMPAFYTKTLGQVQFTIAPGFYNVDHMTTTAYTTTGFYQKPIGQTDRTVTINTIRNTKYTGITGANTIGNLPTGGKVEVGAWDGASSDSISFPPSNYMSPWTSRTIGQDFRISGINAQAGEFFVQYFVKQGSETGQTTAPGAPTLAPITYAPGQPTPRPIQTTTSSSPALHYCLSFMVLLFGFAH